MVTPCVRACKVALCNTGVGLGSGQHQQQMIVIEGAGGQPHQRRILAEINRDAGGQ